MTPRERRYSKYALNSMMMKEMMIALVNFAFMARENDDDLQKTLKE